jgi:cytochrome b6-f complex iron-sulfur subunit
MVDDERVDDARLGRDAERFDRYLDALLGAGRPSPDAIAGDDEAEMARTAAELVAHAGAAEIAGPDPAFVEQLRRRMRHADEAIGVVRTPPPVRDRPRPAGRRRWRLTRRQLLQAGIGGAAGLAAGATGMALLRPSEAADGAPPRSGTLVGGDGYWAEVAAVEDLPEGSALRFSTAAFDGFVVNDGGTVRALSSACTHMGCTLHFRPDWRDLRCPCHGASFDLEGRLANGREAWHRSGAYPGDAAAYPVELPDLPRPRVKVEAGRIWVWTAQV